MTAREPAARLWRRIGGEACVAGIWLFACWPFLTGARFVDGDSLGMLFPQTKYLADTLRSGAAPFWNPLLNGGQPALGDPQSMFFTPYMLAGLLTGSGFTLHVFTLVTMLTLLAGGLAMLACCRPYAGNRAWPVLGAAVFMLGGVATSRMQHANQILSYALLPFLLLALRGVARAPGWRSAAWLALPLALDFLNPNQVVYLSAIALAPFFLLHVVESPQRWHAVAWAGGACAVAVFAASPVLSAAAEFVRLSNRPDLPLAASVPWSFPFYNMAGLFLPGLYGVMRPERGYWPPTDASEDYLYVGLIPLGVALLACARLHRTPPVTLIAACMTAFWLVYALGPHAPLYPFLFDHLPGQSGFRRPADGAFLANFSLALTVGTASFSLDGLRALGRRRALAAMLAGACLVAVFAAAAWALRQRGLDIRHGGDLWFIARQFAWRSAILAVAGLFVALFWQRGGARAAAPLAVVFAVLDLCGSGRISDAFAPRTTDVDQAQYFDHVRDGGDAARGIAEVIGFLRAHGATDWRHPFRVEILGGSLGGNLPMAAGIATIQGYNPLVFADYDRIIGSGTLQFLAKRFTAAAQNYDREPYRRLGLRYVLLDTNNLQAPGELGTSERAVLVQLSSHGWAHRLPDVANYQVWELQNPRPRAEVIGRAPCDILAYRPDFQHFRCSGGQLVIGDPMAPGWVAWVNGAPAQLRVYGGLFRSLELAAGENDVVLRYRAVPYLRGRK